MAKHWLVVRHVEHEHLGSLASALDAQAIEHRYLDIFRDGALPVTAADLDGLIIMGGPMGVYEQDAYAFVRPELHLIRQAIDAGLPVVGICLGAQMIAAALGSRVFASGKKEIGWYPLRSVAAQDGFAGALPEAFMGFHWHGDTFDLPPGAVRLFESDLFPQQGFRWRNNVLALQFHFEVNRQMIGEWLADDGCRKEIAGVPGLSAAKILSDTEAHCASLEKLSEKYFTNILQQLTATLAK